MAFSDVVRPDYSVKYFRPGFYKLVRFKRSPLGFSGKPTVNKSKGIEKHEASISRARSMVFQLAMCNHWEYFFTGTLNPEWHDRHNLDRFRSSFAQFVRDCRKRYQSDIRYLFVCEQHKDGAWHMHGLISGIPQDRLSRFVPGIHPSKLVNGDFLNWGDYAQKFGFCSLGPVRDEMGCAFYLEKYISKDMDRSVSELSAHTYNCSRGLCRAVPFGSIYGVHSDLSRYLTADYEFCSCGFVRNVTWDFWCGYCEVDGYLDSVFPLEDIPAVPDHPAPCAEWEQMVLFGFPSSQFRGVE